MEDTLKLLLILEDVVWYAVHCCILNIMLCFCICVSRYVLAAYFGVLCGVISFLDGQLPEFVT